MDSPTLSAAIRSNLTALQSNATLLARTQTRLGSGKKVASATDNPASYFTIQSLTNRSADLTNRLDGIAKGIQTVKAADTGITGIITLLSQARGVAADARALATDATTERDSSMQRFNDLLGQIDRMAEDSGYDGINLLTAGKLTVNFSEKAGDSTINLDGFDARSNGTVVTAATQNTGSWSSTSTGSATDYLSDAALGGYLSYLGFGSLTATMTGWSLNPNSTADRQALIGLLGAWTGARPGQYQSYGEWYFSNYPSVSSGTGNDAIDTAISTIETSLTSLRLKSKEIASNLGVLSARQDFTQDMTNLLTLGAENLANADMNEESANLLALSTQQSLGVNSLSLASKSGSSVLQLLA